MKKSITLALLLLGIQLAAQQSIAKKIPIEGRTNISVELPYAKTIEINTWSKNEVFIEGSVTIEEGKYDDYFKLKIKERANTLSIRSNYGKLFKKEKRFFDFSSRSNKGTTIKMGHEEDENLTVDGIAITAVYVIHIPQYLALTLKSNSANVISTSFDGNLTTDIISGDITINDYTGDLSLKTVSGSIRTKIGKAAVVKAKTTVGKIFKEERIPNLVIGEKIVGSFANGKFDHGIHSLNLSTVSGDIHLRN